MECEELRGRAAAEEQRRSCGGTLMECEPCRAHAYRARTCIPCTPAEPPSWSVSSSADAERTTIDAGTSCALTKPASATCTLASSVAPNSIDSPRHSSCNATAQLRSPAGTLGSCPPRVSKQGPVRVRRGVVRGRGGEVVGWGPAPVRQSASCPLARRDRVGCAGKSPR